MSEVRFFQNTQDQTQIPLAGQSGCPRLLIGRGFFASPPWVLRFGRWTVTAAERDGVPIDDVVVRNVVGKILEPIVNWLYLFQNFHLIHHLFPRVPFYLYSKAFRSLKPWRTIREPF